MREVYKEHTYDIVFNLFTSFEYFDNYDDNLIVLHSFNTMLVADGKLVIDFMNEEFVLKNVVKEEVKTMDGIDFHITRTYDGKHIYKNINFFFQAEDGIRDGRVTGVQTCALPISMKNAARWTMPCASWKPSRTMRKISLMPTSNT